MYQNISEEMKKVLTSSKDKIADDIFRHLFYGSNSVKPDSIYTNKDGLEYLQTLKDLSKKTVYLSDNS